MSKIFEFQSLSHFPYFTHSACVECGFLLLCIHRRDQPTEHEGRKQSRKELGCTVHSQTEETQSGLSVVAGASYIRGLGQQWRQRFHLLLLLGASAVFGPAWAYVLIPDSQTKKKREISFSFINSINDPALQQMVQGSISDCHCAFSSVVGLFFEADNVDLNLKIIIIIIYYIHTVTNNGNLQQLLLFSLLLCTHNTCPCSIVQNAHERNNRAKRNLMYSIL